MRRYWAASLIVKHGRGGSGIMIDLVCFRPSDPPEQRQDSCRCTSGRSSASKHVSDVREAHFID
jgi:hypothetical protein